MAGLCADAPCTLYSAPLELGGELELLGLDPLDRIWGRRQLPTDFRHPDDTVALVRALALACNRRSAPYTLRGGG